MRPIVEVKDARLESAAGRVLVDGLTLALDREKVALVGRNGVGKSLLLEGLASGELAGYRRRGDVAYVPQLLPRIAGRSDGEVRRERVAAAIRSRPSLLLLDEPTADLDDAASEWLRAELRAFGGAAIVASHDRRLLEDFSAFFWIRESGCRAFEGSLDALDAEAERERALAEGAFAAELRRLADTEEHMLHVARRKARKKQYGRCRELDRGTPKVRLNAKRGQAQVSHGKHAAMRRARIEAQRALGLAARRALDVRLPLAVDLPADPPRQARPRFAVVGPNGSGKTTYLERLLTGGEDAGLALGEVGHVDQAARSFQVEESLLELLRAADPALDLAGAVERVAAHRLPVALAERPLRTLSPGERVRAALVVLFQRRPRIETLVLDEPTFALDLFGQRALADVLRAWPGGLVIATHDRHLLKSLAWERVVEVTRPRA